MFGGRGPVAALKNVAVTLLSTLQTRLSLLANELQVEKQQVIQQVTLGVALLFCLGIGVLSAIALAVLGWWEYRLWVLAFFTLLFLGMAVWCLLELRRISANATPVLSATLAELQLDLQQLKTTASGLKPDPADDDEPAR
ncbi:MAG: phage holin family protein [Comamonadaceae bacterium]|nr:MAG: phage holin family protein [Comamonadaceae bacterium]